MTTRCNDFRVFPLVVNVLKVFAWIASTTSGEKEKRGNDECFHDFTVPRDQNSRKLIVYPA